MMMVTLLQGFFLLETRFNFSTSAGSKNDFFNLSGMKEWMNVTFMWGLGINKNNKKNIYFHMYIIFL